MTFFQSILIISLSLFTATLILCVFVSNYRVSILDESPESLCVVILITVFCWWLVWLFTKLHQKGELVAPLLDPAILSAIQFLSWDKNIFFRNNQSEEELVITTIETQNEHQQRTENSSESLSQDLNNVNNVPPDKLQMENSNSQIDSSDQLLLTDNSMKSESSNEQSSELIKKIVKPLSEIALNKIMQFSELIEAFNKKKNLSNDSVMNSSSEVANKTISHEDASSLKQQGSNFTDKNGDKQQLFLEDVTKSQINNSDQSLTSEKNQQLDDSTLDNISNQQYDKTDENVNKNIAQNPKLDKSQDISDHEVSSSQVEVEDQKQSPPFYPKAKPEQNSIETKSSKHISSQPTLSNHEIVKKKHLYSPKNKKFHSGKRKFKNFSQLFSDILEHRNSVNLLKRGRAKWKKMKQGRKEERKKLPANEHQVTLIRFKKKNSKEEPKS